MQAPALLATELKRGRVWAGPGPRDPRACLDIAGISCPAQWVFHLLDPFFLGNFSPIQDKIYGDDGSRSPTHQRHTKKQHDERKTPTDPRCGS